MNISSMTKGTKRGITPVDPVTQKEAAAAATPIDADTVAAETQSERSVGDQPDTSEPTDDYGGNPIVKEYMSFLAEHDIDTDDIMQMLDTIMTSGSIEWGTHLFGGKTEVRFRMRSTWVEERIAAEIDKVADSSMTMSRYSNLIRVLNVAGSLSKYGSREIPMNNGDDFEDALVFVRSLPYPIMAAVSNQLAIFDRALAVAMSDWAISNFTPPQPENT